MTTPQQQHDTVKQRLDDLLVVEKDLFDDMTGLRIRVLNGRAEQSVRDELAVAREKHKAASEDAREARRLLNTLRLAAESAEHAAKEVQHKLDGVRRQKIIEEARSSLQRNAPKWRRGTIRMLAMDAIVRGIPLNKLVLEDVARLLRGDDFQQQAQAAYDELHNHQEG